MSENTSFNHLKNEESIYLTQHANDPIYWWSYGPDALQKAQDENKPILLSIGMAACHWCNRMTEESFRNEKIAQILNDNFICIKIDRDEYPDIDQYYQKAAMAFGKHGGHPLNVFLLPDMRPFFVGSYFPKDSTDKLPGFEQLITELTRAYKEEKETIEKNATDVTSTVISQPMIKDKVEFPGHFPSPSSILNAIKSFADNENGGYGDAPKFPTFAFWEWAIEHMAENMVAKEFGEHIIKSLDKMIMGGIYDQIRGGVHRLSKDKKWLTPHFEKFIYDQAGLLKLLTKLTLIYPSPVHFDAILQTIDYLESEMLSEKNFFHNAQDSDSEGHEGLYFTYTEEEFDQAMAQFNNDQINQNIDKIKKWFSITPDGNYSNKLNIITLDYQAREELFKQDNWELVRLTKYALLQERKTRIPPVTDPKGVASHNFFMVSALCDVIQYTKIDVIRNMASKLLNSALESVHSTFIIPNSSGEKASIRHTTTQPTSLPYFEDYVFFAESELRVYEITGNKVFKTNAIDTAQYIFNDFEKNGRFFTRSKVFDDSRPYANIEQSCHDDAFRSPVATFINLIRRLTILTGESEMKEKLRELIEYATHASLQHPLAHGEALRALSYPDEVYRKIHIPKKWLQDPKFTNFLPHFPSRFVLDYHEEENEKWQFLNMKECELQGDGFEEFAKVFIPQEKESQND